MSNIFDAMSNIVTFCIAFLFQNFFSVLQTMNNVIEFFTQTTQYKNVKFVLAMQLKMNSIPKICCNKCKCHVTRFLISNLLTSVDAIYKENYIYVGIQSSL